MELTTEIIIAILTLITAVLTGGTIVIRHLNTSDIEDILMPQRNYAIKMLVIIVFSTALTHMMANMFSMLIFSQITPFIDTFNFFLLLLFIILIPLVLQYFLILWKKYHPILYILTAILSIQCTNFSLIVVIETVENMNITEYIIALVISWLTFSFLNFYYFSDKKAFINRTPVTIRLMTKAERREVFTNGMFTVHSVQPDIQIVRPCYNIDKDRNSYPKYLYYALIDEVHIFEQPHNFFKGNKLPDRTWTSRKDRHKK